MRIALPTIAAMIVPRLPMRYVASTQERLKAFGGFALRLSVIGFLAALLIDQVLPNAATELLLLKSGARDCFKDGWCSFTALNFGTAGGEAVYSTTMGLSVYRQGISRDGLAYWHFGLLWHVGVALLTVTIGTLVWANHLSRAQLLEANGTFKSAA